MSATRPPGSLVIYDSSLNVWEEPHGCTGVYEEGFRREVLAGIVRLLRARGWHVTRDPGVHARWPTLDKSHRRCTHPSGLQAGLEQGGRHIKLELYQAVTKPENPNGSRYDFDKLKRMPYLLRLKAIANLLFIAGALCRAYGYTGPDTSLREMVLGPGLATNREHLARARASWGRPMPGVEAQSRCNRESSDGVLLSNGDRVWFHDDKGRWLTGLAEYSDGNNMWWVLWGTHGMAHQACWRLQRASPADPRRKDNAKLRAQRLEQLMLAAAKQEEFLRAEQLRRVLRHSHSIPTQGVKPGQTGTDSSE